MSILNQPCRVNERAEVLYFFNGDVCVDVQSGAPERRKAVLEFLAQAQEMAKMLLERGRFAVEPNGDTEVWHSLPCWQAGRAMCSPDCERIRGILLAAGVLREEG